MAEHFFNNEREKEMLEEAMAAHLATKYDYDRFLIYDRIWEGAKSFAEGYAEVRNE